MIRLLDLTLKINKDRYKDGAGDNLPKHRIIKPSSFKIKDQTGGSISRLKIRNNAGIVGENELLVRDVGGIVMFSSSLDIPISWAWKNRAGREEIEFTLKNLKYDEEKGLLIGLRDGRYVLYLNEENFETEVFETKSGKKFFNFFQIVKLAVENQSVIFNEFSDLLWKAFKNVESEEIGNLAIEIEQWQNANSLLDEKGEFYELENINNGEKKVEEMCQNILGAIQYLKEWEDVGVKTIEGVWEAKENGFDIVAEPGLDALVSEEGKYKGFYIGNGEKYQTLITLTSSLFSSVPVSLFFLSGSKNRYTRKNIDDFRELFPNNANQDNPKYFLGFRPGDIQKIGSQFYSVFHQRDIKDKKGNFWEMKFDGEEFSRTYYELRSCYESTQKEASEKTQINEILFCP